MTTTSMSILLLLFIYLPVFGTNPCPSGCNVCKGIICISCLEGFWLSQENICEPCLGNCETCDRDSYLNRCHRCKQNFWGTSSLCLNSCSSNCLDRLCEETNGNCYQCITGFYGFDCTKNCSMCKNKYCSRTDCPRGCIDGYFTDSAQGSYYCRECAPGCIRCDSYYHCLQCEASSFMITYISENGDNRSVCQSCQLPNCASCLNVDTCTSCQTIPNCLQCRLVNGEFYTCSLCENGFTLTNGFCQQGIQCPPRCSSGCDSDGACVLGCTDGYTGQFCNKSCSESCFSCSQTDRNECTQCHDDSYTTTCNIACNPNCIRVPSQSTCDIKDGFCLNGCLSTFWGNMCEKACSPNCLNSNDLLDNEVCSRMHGTCVYGCVNGYLGQMCNIKVTENTELTPSQSTENAITTRKSEFSTQSPSENRSRSDSQGAKGSTATAIGASVGGGVAVVTIIVIVIVVIMRKRIQKKPSQFCSHVYENAGIIEISQPDSNQASSIELSVPPSETSVYEQLSGKTHENHYSVLSK